MSALKQLTGKVKLIFFLNLGTDGIRDSSYVLSEYDEKNQLMEYILFQVVGANVNITELVNETAIWTSRNGFVPVSVPRCGFDGKGLFQVIKNCMILVGVLTQKLKYF